MRSKHLLSFIILFVLLCFSLIVSVKAVSMWDRTYGGPLYEDANSLVATSDGGYAIAGSCYYSGTTDFWLMKADETGNMEWNQTYGNPGTGYEVANSLIETPDGGFALAGLAGIWPKNALSPDYDSYQFWLVKTDSFGNMEWNRTYVQGKAHSVVATSDGGYAMAGYPYSSTGGVNASARLVKTDAAGNMQWNRTYGGPEVNTAYSLVVAPDGGYAITGETTLPGSENIDSWLIKTDASGNMLWNKTYGGVMLDYAYSLVITSDGGYALAGHTYLTMGEAQDYWLVKTDALGNMEWNQTYGTTGPGWGSSVVNTSDMAESLVATSDGGYALAGGIYSGGETLYRAFWLVKTDAFGSMEWNKRYERESGGKASSLVATFDGGYALVGNYRIVNTSQTRVWLIKTDEYGVFPEYNSWLIPVLVLTATAFVMTKRRRKEKRYK